MAKHTPPPDDSVDEFGFPTLEESQQAIEASNKKAADKKAAPAKRRVQSENSSSTNQVKPDATEASEEEILADGFDGRKLTKKQQKFVTDKWGGANRGKAVDAVFRAQVEQARIEFGHQSVLVGKPDEQVLIGIACPALAFEYLIAQNIFPLGCVIHLVGPPSSCKSPLLYEFMRWFRNAGGGSVLQEAETKFSPELIKSIVGFADDEVNVIVNKCISLEDWQRKLLFWLDKQKKALDGTKEEPGPGRTVPILFGVDSIMGKAAEETQEKVLDAGSAGRSFPIEALSITNYMRTIPHQLEGYPFSLVLNNHLKMSKDGDGNEVRNIAGGQGVKFQESFEIQTNVKNAKIQCADWDGVTINMRCYKNSFGPSQRQIEARMLWWEEETEPGSGVYKQITRWDWDWATIRMLASMKDRDPRTWNRLKSAGFHISIGKQSMVENSAWSDSLGMKEKDACSWSELGKMIRSDAKVLKLVRDGLGIKRKPLLHGDYYTQLNELIEKAT